jgi:hypothetical protein
MGGTMQALSALRNGVLIAAIAGAACAQPMSSFQDSCRHIRVEGATLSADCRRIDGSFNETAIEIPGIAYINGNLQYQ